MTHYVGTVLGFNYDMEFDREKDFIDWIVAKLLRQSPMMIKILKVLMEQE